MRFSTSLLVLLAGCAFVTEEELGTALDQDADGWLQLGTNSLDEPVDNSDCDDADPFFYPGAIDVRGDGCDSDCGAELDSDGDDWPDSSDCAPNDPTIYPCAAGEVDGDGVDSDCDGADSVRWVDCETADPSPRVWDVASESFIDATEAVEASYIDHLANLATCVGDGGKATGTRPDTDTDDTDTDDTDTDSGDTDTDSGDTDSGDTDTDTDSGDTDSGDTDTPVFNDQAPELDTILYDCGLTTADTWTYSVRTNGWSDGGANFNIYETSAFDSSTGVDNSWSEHGHELSRGTQAGTDFEEYGEWEEMSVALEISTTVQDIQPGTALKTLFACSYYTPDETVSQTLAWRVYVYDDHDNDSSTSGVAADCWDFGFEVSEIAEMHRADSLCTVK